MKCIPSNKTRKSRMFLDKFYNHTQLFCDLDASLADETEVQVVAKLEAYDVIKQTVQVTMVSDPRSTRGAWENSRKLSLPPCGLVHIFAGSLLDLSLQKWIVRYTQ
jgi:hypothetical protein